MTVYAVAQGRVSDPQQLDRYVAAALPTLTAHNVEVIAFDSAATMIEGQVDYPRTVILKFVSESAFYDWYNSAEYTAARKLRETASEGTFILVTGTE